MKRTILFILLALFIAGCEKEQVDAKPNKPVKISNNTVVEGHGGVENSERLDLFVENVKNKEKDKVRIVHYTTEGDPLYHDLAFNGSELSVKFDTSKDEFGQGEVFKYTCKDIQKQESNTETKYLLNECPEVEELVTISHDVDQQDNFDFELKYGVGKKNKINTKEQQLVKDLQNGEVVTVSDFQFSKEELNQIYKAMILSSYLNEKKLSKQCNQKPYEGYELKVWINDASKQFEWTECDQSKDGKQMNKLVKKILDVLKNNPTYQSLPAVKGGAE